jgi:hypothetical protein
MRDNYRVVIEPDIRYAGLGKKDSIEIMKAQAADGKYQSDSILKDVKRHVDGIHSAYVESDDASICEHCHAKWTEASTSYNGGCCAKDEESNTENVVTA